MTSASSTAIEVHGLVKKFGAFRALDGLTFKVERGSVTGFLGLNGAGKTTTLNILAGLASASSGEAWVEGVRASRESLPLRRHLGFLPEEPSFHGWMTAREALGYVAGLVGLTGPDARKRRDEMLELVGLSAAAGRRVSGFSRGMRQRLGIAQALMHQPAILLLDEPTSALDPEGRYEVIRLIEGLKGQGTILVSSHILSDVERFCDSVVVVHHGRTVVQAPIQELREQMAPPVAEIEVAGPVAALRTTLEAQSWVERVEIDPDNATQLRVWPSDDGQARQALPGAIVSSGVTLLRYEWTVPALEEVFLGLVNEQEAQP